MSTRVWPTIVYSFMRWVSVVLAACICGVRKSDDCPFLADAMLTKKEKVVYVVAGASTVHARI